MSASPVTQNACKLCAPLGAALAFKGIAGAVPLLHGSQGCATYIRRYLISHFKEPVDIASSNFSEDAAIFGGASNLKTALDNIARQYAPDVIGIATTCLAETIGDDVPGLLREYAAERLSPTLTLHVPTPSYCGTHADGFHRAVLLAVEALTRQVTLTAEMQVGGVNLFPGILSPADLRHFKAILADFGLPFTLLPDYAQTLDGGQWDSYQKIPPGGTPLEAIRQMACATASLELGWVLSEGRSAAKLLKERFGVPCNSLGLPIGVRESDPFFDALVSISGRPMPDAYAQARARLIDAYVDGHKYVSGVRAAVYGEEDLVVGLAAFLSEIGVHPVLCASGGKSEFFETALRRVVPRFDSLHVRALSGADFYAIGEAAKHLGVELIVGNSKGYSLAREMNVPLVRVGFPLHDRFGGARVLHVGYHGAQQLFDRVVNALIEHRQSSSEIGYAYM
ncbi:MAG: nitrogenase component 1 [Chloroflexota bacterium]